MTQYGSFSIITFWDGGRGLSQRLVPTGSRIGLGDFSIKMDRDKMLQWVGAWMLDGKAQEPPAFEGLPERTISQQQPSVAANVTINGRSLISATLHIDQDYIDVTSSHERDPDWTFVDLRGHFHAYSSDGGKLSLPTLKGVEIWVPCEGCSSHDDEEVCSGYSRIEMRCVICDEPVKPGMRETVGQKTIPGRYSWRLEFTAYEHEFDFGIAPQTMVSVVRTEADGKQMFGVGRLWIKTREPNGIVTGVVRDAGELGKR